MTTETHTFQTEAQKLLKLMINSLYSNREVFLRELISNAADAIDKLRFEALSDESLLSEDPELSIRLIHDAETNTLTIQDNGIGMSREELVTNLGTIAKSGTEQFFEMLTSEQQQDSNLIGQFGVGFYSAFLVADQINVTSRRAGTETTSKWSSSGEADFTIEDVEPQARGTSIELILKEDASEFTDEYRIREIVRQYSDHVDVPIWLANIATEDQSSAESIDDSDESEGEGDETPEPTPINSAQALWTRSKNSITEDEYKAFYRGVSHDFQEPLLWAHNRVEGKVDYTSLIYVPAKAPMFFNMQDKSHGIKLYAQRVFITDQLELFLPDNLNFVKGVVDIRDLPLNMSRETIQENDQIRSVRSAVVKRIVDSLLSHANKEPDSYNDFWSEFGQQMKVAYDWSSPYDEKYYRLLRFASTASEGTAQTTSLDDYLERADKEQEFIYYLIGESISSLRSNPLLEHYEEQGIEVLLLGEDFDSYVVERFGEFKEHAFKDISLQETELPKNASEADAEEVESTDDELLNRIKEQLEEGPHSDVVASSRLSQSASCLVRERPWVSRGVRHMMKETNQFMPEEKLVLELNMKHPLIGHLRELKDDEKFKSLALTLLDQAQLAYGSLDVDTAAYVRRVNTILTELLS